MAALEPETARALLGLARDATTLRARLVDLLDAFDGIGAGQRPARPGEVCTCGDPAVVVYETARFGDVGHCGVEHVGRSGERPEQRRPVPRSTSSRCSSGGRPPPSWPPNSASPPPPSPLSHHHLRDAELCLR